MEVATVMGGLLAVHIIEDLLVSDGPMGLRVKSTSFHMDQATGVGASGSGSGDNGKASGTGNSSNNPVDNVLTSNPFRELGLRLEQDRARAYISRALTYSRLTGTPSLGEVGFGLGTSSLLPGRTEETFLFERFIDRNPHLNAFNQYYGYVVTGRLTNNTGRVTRCMSFVKISDELIDALKNSNMSN